MLALLCLVSLNALARADGEPPPTGAPTTAPPPPAAPPPPPVAESGPTLRNGFSLSVGEEFGSGPSAGLDGQLYGVDWRIGARITGALAIYLHSHLSFGTAHIGAASGVTGNFASAIVGEYTLPMRIFLGAGAGYGVLNNPHGPLAELRAGWYPFETASAEKVRRLNIAVDARFYFPGDAIGRVTQIALSVGYDRF